MKFKMADSIAISVQIHQNFYYFLPKWVNFKNSYHHRIQISDFWVDDVKDIKFKTVVSIAAVLKFKIFAKNVLQSSHLSECFFTISLLTFHLSGCFFPMSPVH